MIFFEKWPDLQQKLVHFRRNLVTFLEKYSYLKKALNKTFNYVNLLFRINFFAATSFYIYITSLLNLVALKYRGLPSYKLVRFCLSFLEKKKLVKIAIQQLIELAFSYL